MNETTLTTCAHAMIRPPTWPAIVSIEYKFHNSTRRGILLQPGWTYGSAHSTGAAYLAGYYAWLKRCEAAALSKKEVK